MAKALTKEQFRNLLRQEIESWERAVNDSTGLMKEQAIGRKLEAEWLLSAFEGKAKIK